MAKVLILLSDNISASKWIDVSPFFGEFENMADLTLTFTGLTDETVAALQEGEEFVIEIKRKNSRAPRAEKVDPAPEITALGLSGRTHNALVNRAGITTKSALTALTYDDLENIRGLGAKGISEIISKLSSLGLALSLSAPGPEDEDEFDGDPDEPYTIAMSVNHKDEDAKEQLINVYCDAWSCAEGEAEREWNLVLDDHMKKKITRETVETFAKSMPMTDEQREELYSMGVTKEELDSMSMKRFSYRSNKMSVIDYEEVREDLE